MPFVYKLVLNAAREVRVEVRLSRLVLPLSRDTKRPDKLSPSSSNAAINYGNQKGPRLQMGWSHFAASLGAPVMISIQQSFYFFVMAVMIWCWIREVRG
jgi:hypothetical protein